MSPEVRTKFKWKDGYEDFRSVFRYTAVWRRHRVYRDNEEKEKLAIEIIFNKYDLPDVSSVCRYIDTGVIVYFDLVHYPDGSSEFVER